MAYLNRQDQIENALELIKAVFLSNDYNALNVAVINIANDLQRISYDCDLLRPLESLHEEAAIVAQEKSGIEYIKGFSLQCKSDIPKSDRILAEEVAEIEDAREYDNQVRSIYYGGVL